MNERAYSALTCGEAKSFWIIYNSSTTNLPCGSALLAWDRLKAKIKPKTGAMLTQLKCEFTTSKLQKGGSPDEWVEKLETIRTTIEQIMVKCHIDNDNMMLHIINNIPNNYNIIVNRITMELSNKTLTLDFPVEDLQEKFERMKDKKEHKGETSFYAKQNKTRCYLCGKIGHKKKNCNENEDNKDKRPKGWKKNYQPGNKNENKNKNRK
jgi:gag-polypeptide of LTR copia-type